MNKTFKTVFVGAAVSFAAFRLAASDSWYDAAQQVSWGFTVENGEATISTPGFWDSNARDNCKGDIVVPSRIGPDGPNGAKTYPVRDMAPGLFRNCTKVTSVRLPDGIRRVAPNAFYFDRDSIITNVVIGEGCLDICENAFLRCEKLVSLNIPNTVTNIGKNAIQLCKVLPRIDIPGSVKTIGNSAFAACYALETVTFGDGIEIIDVDAFMNCSSLLAADLPASVRSIGDRAFYNCVALASATLREGLEQIGFCAFNQCESLASVSIPSSVTWVGERAFQYCPDSIFDKDTVPGVCLLSGWAVGVDNPSGAIDLFGVNGVADGLLKDCRNVTSAVFPPGIETLGDSMFNGCLSLESVGLPVALKSIEDYAFQNCRKLQAANIPSGVTNIGQYAFAYCEKLANVTLPDGLAAMDDNAFKGCTNLTSVTIPASLKRIPMGAFENCTGLANVTVEDGVEVIGNASFYGCRGLPAFTIPDSVTVVEDIAFGSCAFLDTNTIANVEMVDGWIVGSSQPNLTEVTVPGDVRGISECAFSYRHNLTNAVVEEGVAALPFQAFAFDAKLTDLSLPASLVEIGKQVFCGCRGLVEIYVPSNVVAIGEEAFASCTALERVYLPIALRGKVNEANLINGSFNAKILYYRADGSLDDQKRVVFDPNGGELAETEAARDVKEGTAVGALPEPTRLRYTFLGWFTEKEWGDKVTAATKIEDNVTFYAHWEEDPGWLVLNFAQEYETMADGSFNLVLVDLVESGAPPKFTVKDLPSGLKYNATTMAISGRATKPGAYKVTMSATNTKRKTPVTATFRLVVPNLKDEAVQVEDAYPAMIPGVACTLTIPGAADCKVSGLPAGMKWTAKAVNDKTLGAVPVNSAYGTPTKPGTYTVYFTKTVDRVKHTATSTFTVGPFPVLTIDPFGNGTGKVTGAGAYAANKKVPLKATADTKDALATVKSVFGGWYEAPDPESKPLSFSASYSYVMPAEDATLYARFVTAAEDAAAVRLAVDGVELAAGPSNPPYQTNVMCGVYLEWPVSATALSDAKVKVAGLPAGLKFTDKPITAKVGSGAAAVLVTNVPAFSIYGAPTAASKVDKNGNPTPSAVKITVTTAGKSSVAYLIALTVDALPNWAAGTFDGGMVGSPRRGDRDFGPLGERALPGEVSGQVALTIATSGKISGKILEGGKTWTLSAAWFDEARLAEDGSPHQGPSFTATVIAKAGKEVATNEVTVAVDAARSASGPYLSGVVSGAFDIHLTTHNSQLTTYTWTAYQNLWKRADAKASQPVFKKSIDKLLELGAAGDAANTVKLTFKKDGVVAFAGKVGGASVSGSSQLVPRLAEDGSPYQVTLYAPPKKGFDGWCKTLAVTLVVDDQNVVTEVAAE